ncbi:MAG: hypothetical protein ACRD0K_19690 [Egibacteraceae bacterium]
MTPDAVVLASAPALAERSAVVETFRREREASMAEIDLVEAS